MKKNTVFTDLKGTIGDYVRIIYTESGTHNDELISLQQELNKNIKVASRMSATKENLNELWSRLVYKIYSLDFKDKNDRKYIEIVKAVDDIGNKIAYLVPREGLILIPSTVNGILAEAIEKKNIEMLKLALLHIVTWSKEKNDGSDYNAFLYKDDEYFKGYIERYSENEGFRAVM